MVKWRIEPLDRSHDRSAFRCGKPSLDEFLRTLVNQYEKRRLGRTYVAVHEGDLRVYGYYTIAAGAVSFHELPKEARRKLPKHPVPTILLARLAVDETAQGKRLGEALLMDALSRCVDLSDTLGVYAVKVEAIDDSASRFYQKYGFVPLPDNERALYLPITTIKAGFGQKRDG